MPSRMAPYRSSCKRLSAGSSLRPLTSGQKVGCEPHHCVRPQGPSQLPAISEPLFSKLKATIEMFPVMNQEDLQKGLQQVGQGA